MNEMGAPLVNVPNSIASQQQAVYGSGVAMSEANRSPSLAEQYKAVRSQRLSKDKVLEYFEAQLNMDLFKDDKLATLYFEEAMRWALERLVK